MTGKEFNDAFDELTRYLVGYDDLVMQLKLAFLTKSHVLINGRTGAGKSYAARTALGLISDAKIFRTQVSAFTLPDHLVGAMIPEKYLSTGEQIYNIANGLADTHFALLDEFTDIPDALAKSLNTLLHERAFETKDMSVRIPLHTAIMTSNSIPAARSWEPVLARILFQYEAANVQGYYDRYRMQKVFEETHGEAPALSRIPYASVVELCDKVKEKVVPDGVHFLLAYIVEEYSKTIGDRPRSIVCGRENAALVDVIRAAAVLEDRDVAYQHLYAIKYALCTMGVSESGAREQQILEEIIQDALPQAKHLQAELRTYDNLGSLAAQIVSAQTNPDAEKRFMLPFDFIKNAKFAWLTELESYMAEVSGRVAFHSARALANDLRRQANLLNSKNKK